MFHLNPNVQHHQIVFLLWRKSLARKSWSIINNREKYPKFRYICLKIYKLAHYCFFLCLCRQTLIRIYLLSNFISPYNNHLNKFAQFDGRFIKLSFLSPSHTLYVRFGSFYRKLAKMDYYLSTNKERKITSTESLPKSFVPRNPPQCWEREKESSAFEDCLCCTAVIYIDGYMRSSTKYLWHSRLFSFNLIAFGYWAHDHVCVCRGHVIAQQTRVYVFFFPFR